MLRIELDGELESRLRMAAARLKRAPDDCVRSAVRAFVEDCEEAVRHALQLSQGESFVRNGDEWGVD
jgi:predicted transcriptional regulator